jgi:hypothetical protein
MARRGISEKIIFIPRKRGWSDLLLDASEVFDFT